MAWLAVDPSGNEAIFKGEPIRYYEYCVGKSRKDCECWIERRYITDEIYYNSKIQLPKGTIKKLIGRDLSWEDKPVELKEK